MGGKAEVSSVLRHVIAAILIATFLGLGSGAMQYLHELDHGREDARAGLPHQEHDENNCVFHAQLRSPIVSAAAWVPLLVCLGLLVAFLTLLAELPVYARPTTPLDCRGPPALLHITA